MARESKREIFALDSGFVVKDKTLGFTGKDRLLADQLVSFIKAIENNDTNMNATLRTTDMRRWNMIMSLK